MSTFCCISVKPACFLFSSLLFLFSSASVLASSEDEFDAFVAQQAQEVELEEQAFLQYQQALEAGFDAYQKAYQQEFEAYSREIT